MSSSSRGTTAGLAAACLMLSVAPCAAQQGVGFHAAFGWQDTAGDLGDVFDPAIDAEFSVSAPWGPVRIGGGANWASFDVTGQPASFSQVRMHALASVPFRLSELIRPYVQARLTHRRLRPEDDRFHGGDDELLRDFVASGWGVEGVAGVLLMVSSSAALDLSAALAPFRVSPDLSSEGLGPVDSGISWRVHAGVSWFPVNGR